MTYQGLLEEFAKRRSVRLETSEPIIRAINDLDWAIQSILEKLRDGEKT